MRVRRVVGLAATALVTILLPRSAEPTNLVPFLPIDPFTNTDYVVAGVGGLRDFGTGEIALSGIGTGTIDRAFAFWHGPTNLNPPPPMGTTNSSITINGQAFPGISLGPSDDNCWGYLNSVAWFAEVTLAVTGDGTYVLTGLGADPNNTPNGINVNGASLIVLLDDGDPNNNRDLAIFIGNDSTMANPYETELSGFNALFSNVQFNAAPGATANLQLHVADGQVGIGYEDGDLYLTPLGGSPRSWPPGL